MNIRNKLLLSNVALILTLLLVTSISFHFLSNRYLVNTAKRQMQMDSEEIAGTLKDMKWVSDPGFKERLAEWNELKVAGRQLQSKIVIMDNNNRILYTNLNRDDKNILKLAQQNDKDYVIIRQPIRNEAGEIKGRIILAAKVKDISVLNRLMRGTQLASIVIGGIVSLILGYWLGRSISRPIQSLAAAMRSFSPKQELPKVDVGSRDEIRELADSFLDMAGKLQVNDRKQSEFLQNASHELKTPLMAIQGNAEAIKDGIVEGREAEESLEVIVVECQRLKAVVDELIYLSRLDGVSESFRFERQSIGRLLTEVVSSMQGLADQKGITLTLLGDHDAEAAIDREKLKRAFINIVGNGIRYAKSRIVLRVGRIGSELEVVCEDDGQGFSPGEAERIFDRFYKGDHGGTGIGLAITRAIVEAHGGSIQALQGTSTGAMFRMTLPLG